MFSNANYYELSKNIFKKFHEVGTGLVKENPIPSYAFIY